MPISPDVLEQEKRFVGRDMSEAEVHTFSAGVVAVYSSRCPEKESANEDAALLLPCDGGRGVLAVADGFGGQPAGAQASERALSAVAGAVQKALSEGSELREGILNGFEQANEAVCALGVGAATTLAVVEIADDLVRPYHAGDSEVLVVGQRGKVKLTTLSHSPVGYAVEAGVLEESEALDHEDRHIVSNLVGSSEMRIDVGPVLKLSQRDTVLIASDGLFDNLQIDEIVGRIRKGPLGRAADALAGACRRRMQNPTDGLPSKPDDLTFMLFRLRG